MTIKTVEEQNVEWSNLLSVGNVESSELTEELEIDKQKLKLDIQEALGDRNCGMCGEKIEDPDSWHLEMFMLETKQSEGEHSDLVAVEFCENCWTKRKVKDAL